MIILYPVLIATVVPCLLFIGLIHHLSRHRKVASLLHLKFFGAGFIAPLAAIIMEYITFELCDFFPEKLVISARAFLGIAVVEEGLKLAIILVIARKRRDFNGSIDGVIYAITAAMGFALMENILYVLNSQAPIKIALMRGITAVPLHALAGGFTGLAITRKGTKSIRRIGGAFFIAVFIHGLYNWCLMDDGIADFLIFPLLAIGWLILGWLLGRARKQDIEFS